MYRPRGITNFGLLGGCAPGPPPCSRARTSRPPSAASSWSESGWVRSPHSWEGRFVSTTSIWGSTMRCRSSRAKPAGGAEPIRRASSAACTISWRPTRSIGAPTGSRAPCCGRSISESGRAGGTPPPPPGGDPPPAARVSGPRGGTFGSGGDGSRTAHAPPDNPPPLVLCRDGFRTMLGRLANDTLRRAVGRAVSRGKTCAPENWLESPIRCDMDQSFERFVENPERFLAGKLGLMLHQLWKVEHESKLAGEKDWAGVAALSEAVFQSGIAYRYRRGLDLNTSSVPQRAGKAWLATLLPNYVSVNTKSRGFELGYRPTLHLSNPWALALDAVPLHLTGDPASDVDRYRWAVGPALHWKRTSTVWSGVEAGVEVFGRWRGNPIGAEPVWSIPVTWYLLADKLRIGVRVFPSRDAGVQGAPRADFSVGLADVNGLLYWMLRRS